MTQAWKTACRREQEAWKQRSDTLPPEAREDGHTWIERSGAPLKVGPYPVCLPLDHAAHNLVPSVRAEALRRFAAHGIRWHGDGPDHVGPSSHLLSSQVHCVNTLLSLGEALLEFTRQAVPDATAVAPIEDDSPVAFEWIGLQDHLGEGRGRPRRRGQFVTSADALLVADSPRGRTAIVVEWKLVELGRSPVSTHGPGGTDRRRVYADALARAELAIDVEQALVSSCSYQLLRQLLLGAEMVRTSELGVRRAVLLHACPTPNRAQLDAPGPDWANVGGSVEVVRADTRSWMSATPELEERYGGLADLDP